MCVFEWSLGLFEVLLYANVMVCCCASMTVTRAGREMFLNILILVPSLTG